MVLECLGCSLLESITAAGQDVWLYGGIFFKSLFARWPGLSTELLFLAYLDQRECYTMLVRGQWALAGFY